MKFYQIMSMLLATCLAAPTPESRLISLADGHQEWMTESQLLELIRDRAHFIDITDGEWALFEEQGAASFAPPAYPTAIAHETTVREMITKVDKNYLKTFLDKFSSFNNRYFQSETGVQSAQFLFDELTAIKSQLARSDVVLEIKKMEHTFSQFSIIATLTSAAPSGFSDRIILGAHQDSINRSNPSSGRAPGYDDDGTGVANLLLTLQILLKDTSFVPKRPIEFHFYAAEEGGLRGSQKVAAQYVADKTPVYAMLQSDMTGYPSKDPAIAIVTDYTSPELSSALRLYAKTYANLKVVDTKCGYGCSDHASWTKAGYPASFHFETVFNKNNPNIHTPQDVFSYISLEHAAEFAKTTLGFVVELSLAP